MAKFQSLFSTENAIKCAFIAMMLLFPIVFDGLISWIVKNLIGATFGFPTAYLVSNGDPRYDRSKSWTYFRMGGISGWSTIRVLYLATDDGLAFDIRSAFGFYMMRTVCVPWSALRTGTTSDRAPGQNASKFLVLNFDGSIATTFVVLNPDGTVATTLQPGVSVDKRALASIAERIVRSGVAEFQGG